MKINRKGFLKSVVVGPLAYLSTGAGVGAAVSEESGVVRKKKRSPRVWLTTFPSDPSKTVQRFRCPPGHSPALVYAHDVSGEPLMVDYEIHKDSVEVRTHSGFDGSINIGVYEDH